MRSVALITTLLLATVSFADDRRRRDRYDDFRYRDDRYGYGYGDGSYRGGRAGAGVVQRVMSNLSRSPSYRYVGDHDRNHYEKARYDLQRFQVNWSQGRFDKGRLDSAIDNLKHLVRSDRVHPRERQIFARDIEDLRAFRANRGYANGRWAY
jgi:hypothetical protein